MVWYGGGVLFLKPTAMAAVSTRPVPNPMSTKRATGHRGVFRKWVQRNTKNAAFPLHVSVPLYGYLFECEFEREGEGEGVWE
jgi:hypothetical protein